MTIAPDALPCGCWHNSFGNYGGNDMQVAALAEALTSSRLTDGTISLHRLDDWLSSAGLEELARAVASLTKRASLAKQNVSDDPEHAWF